MSEDALLDAQGLQPTGATRARSRAFLAAAEEAAAPGAAPAPRLSRRAVLAATEPSVLTPSQACCDALIAATRHPLADAQPRASHVPATSHQPPAMGYNPPSHQPWATTHHNWPRGRQAFWSGLAEVGLGTRGQGDLARLQAAYLSQCSLLYTHCAHLARLVLELALTLTIARTVTVARTLTAALSHYSLLLLLLLLLLPLLLLLLLSPPPPPPPDTTTTTTTTAGALLAPGQRLCAPTRRGPATSPLHRARGAPLVITPPPRGM